MAPMASDMVCPYSQSGQNGGKNATFMPTSRCATLGRVKNLEMTEYQRQKYVNGAAGSNIVSPKIASAYFFKLNNTQWATFLNEISKKISESMVFQIIFELINLKDKHDSFQPSKMEL